MAQGSRLPSQPLLTPLAEDRLVVPLDVALLARRSEDLRAADGVLSLGVALDEALQRHVLFGRLPEALDVGGVAEQLALDRVLSAATPRSDNQLRTA